jgi:hypothetical protein
MHNEMCHTTKVPDVECKIHNWVHPEDEDCPHCAERNALINALGLCVNAIRLVAWLSIPKDDYDKLGEAYVNGTKILEIANRKDNPL